ncbi:c-type cytochrome [Pseudohoeflea coraliihabitans]|uniref:Cytochrome c n=1 Tax=Pseudohoeflea coraliihabitans TaxID=2860393 RepID=A0ABS6WSP6_9HYPH|nr:cytochrome c [Pseudohoeflea sp. DP4N28-3]MBW3098979.1 cytochrome c [Pseudohoeflea sp. DP4N28-3]
MTKFLKSTLTAAIVLTGASAVALAHGGATGIVKERMDGMMAMGKVVKELSAMMRGDVAYDADAMREGARTIRVHSGDNLTRLFPEGSGGAPSEAKAAIWSDWENFAALAERLAVEAEGLEAAAGNGLAMPGGDTANSGMGGSGMADMMGTAGSGMMGSGSSTMMGSGSGMMSGGMMGAGRSGPSAEQLAAMPVDGVFNMLARTCSACHSKFRSEKK